ncbi:unnamed protein product [Paramecium sonneborni]|uniref:Uncharacterized protein n=1 Tax=Paramecium sonneborni TaxID=65129 RepID=A0A8S1RSL4_9CILI|nr:unnamed protein product [Paramecium sonneborni]
MDCCYLISQKEKELQITKQISIKEEFSPKALKLEQFSLYLIKGDIDSINPIEKVEKLGSTCDENVLNEKQQSKLENDLNVQIKDEVIIDQIKPQIHYNQNEIAVVKIQIKNLQECYESSIQFIIRNYMNLILL